jgi:hypothetical protein
MKERLRPDPRCCNSSRWNSNRFNNFKFRCSSSNKCKYRTIQPNQAQPAPSILAATSSKHTTSICSPLSTASTTTAPQQFTPQQHQLMSQQQQERQNITNGAGVQLQHQNSPVQVSSYTTADTTTNASTSPRQGWISSEVRNFFEAVHRSPFLPTGYR